MASYMQRVACSSTLLHYCVKIRPQCRKLARCMSSASHGVDGNADVPRYSATTIIAAPVDKPHDDGSQFSILFVQRSLNSSFMPGAYVFPGGVVEDDDSADGWKELANIPKGSRLERLLEPSRICALRETFEEAGVLLMGGFGAELAPKFKQLRKACNSDPTQFRCMIERYLGSATTQPDHHPPPITAALSKLHLWSNFITPVCEPKRFDAKFYVYCCQEENDIIFPASGMAQQDDAETVAVAWMTPRSVLHAVEQGTFFLPPPQWYVVNELAGYTTLGELEAAASTRCDAGVAPIQPAFISGTAADGTPMTKVQLVPGASMTLAFPGDELHPDVPGCGGDEHRLELIGDGDNGNPRYKLHTNVGL